MKNKTLLLLLIFAIPTFSFERTSIDQATFKVGKSFFDRQLYSEAEGRFLDIVRKYPDSPLYHQSLFYLGNTYAHKGEYKPALQYYKLLLTKSKTIAEKQQALLGIAKSWLQLGVHDKAGDFYSFYATEYPESEHAPAALYFAGIARERDDDVSSAIEKYRSIIKDYNNSKYYAKAIEKVAVLDSTTPESLWTQSVVAQSPESTLPSDIWDFEDTGFKAQSASIQQNPLVAPIVHAPTVITQMIQAPPTIITQMVEPVVVTQVIEAPAQIITQTQVITQQISVPSPTPLPVTQPQTQQQNPLKDASIVYNKDGEFVPELTAEQQEKQAMLEKYKKMWEEEQQARQKEQELEKAQQDIRDLAQLSEDKAKILQAKEQSLQEQKDRIQNNVYTDLNQIDILTDTPKYNTPPVFLQPVPNMYNDFDSVPSNGIVDEGEEVGYDEYGEYDEYGYDDDESLVRVIN